MPDSDSEPNMPSDTRVAKGLDSEMDKGVDKRVDEEFLSGVDPAYKLQLASMTFEQMLNELESLARAMDSSAIGIEAATDLYSKAFVLHAAASDRLQLITARVAGLERASKAALARPGNDG